MHVPGESRLDQEHAQEHQTAPEPGPDHASAWLPAEFVHPLLVRFDEQTYLRPIRASDVDIDLVAVRANHEALRRQYGEAWDWPPERLSREADEADLARHAEEAERHESFNYAILTGAEGTDDQRLLGCVYVDPPGPAHADGTPCEAEVSWWCTADAPASLASGLAEFVRGWIASEWPFTAPCAPFNGSAPTGSCAGVDPSRLFDRNPGCDAA